MPISVVRNLIDLWRRKSKFSRIFSPDSSAARCVFPPFFVIFLRPATPQIEKNVTTMSQNYVAVSDPDVGRIVMFGPFFALLPLLDPCEVLERESWAVFGRVWRLCI